MSKYKGKLIDGHEFIFDTDDIKAWQKANGSYYIGILSSDIKINESRLEIDEDLFNQIVKEKENK